MKSLATVLSPLLFGFSVALLFSVGCANSSRTATPENVAPDFESQKAIEDDESAVYATVLKRVAQSPSAILSNTFPDRRAEEVLAENNGRFNDPEVLESLKRSNAQSKSLAPYFDRSSFVLVSEEEDKQLKGGEQIEKWNVFKTQKKVDKIIYFSAIGFDHNRTTAAVSVNTSCGWTCGTMDLYILKKSDAHTWSIDEDISLGVV